MATYSASKGGREAVAATQQCNPSLYIEDYILCRSETCGLRGCCTTVKQRTAEQVTGHIMLLYSI
jgi:hypothetical protein